jgi:hypothetical protein
MEVTFMHDPIPTATGTRVVATVLDPHAIDVPGVVLGLQPGTATHQLQVLVRCTRGTFHTATYDIPATTPAPTTVHHTHLHLPGARLRQAWTDLAMWDLLDIAAGRRGPQGGDAVRLITPVRQLGAGEIGVLLGDLGRPLRFEVATIVVHPATAATLGQGSLASASGHLVLLPVRELTATGQPVALPVWRWHSFAPGRPAEADPVTVPLWNWTPGGTP